MILILIISIAVAFYAFYAGLKAFIFPTNLKEFKDIK